MHVDASLRNNFDDTNNCHVGIQSDDARSANAEHGKLIPDIVAVLALCVAEWRCKWPRHTTMSLPVDMTLRKVILQVMIGLLYLTFVVGAGHNGPAMAFSTTLFLANTVSSLCKPQLRQRRVLFSPLNPCLGSCK